MRPYPQTPNLSFSQRIILAVLATALLSPPALAQTARPGPVEPERAIRQGDMLDHMDEIRQHYPKLYDRLRRSPEAAVHAAGRSAPMTTPPASFEQRFKQAVPARRAP